MFLSFIISFVYVCVQKIINLWLKRDYRALLHYKSQRDQQIRKEEQFCTGQGQNSVNDHRFLGPNELTHTKIKSSPTCM